MGVIRTNGPRLAPIEKPVGPELGSIPTSAPAPARPEAPIRTGAPLEARRASTPSERAGVGSAFGMWMGQAARGARTLAAAGAIASLGFGLAGCSKVEVPPSPGLEVKLSLRDGLVITGETPDRAELRTKLLQDINRRVLSDPRLSFGLEALGGQMHGQLETKELAAWMKKAGVDPSEVQGVRGLQTLGDLVRFLEGGQTADERRAVWAEHLVKTHDRDRSKGLDWSEFSPLLQVQTDPSK